MTTQTQIDTEITNWTELCKNDRGIQSTVKLTPNSEAYYLSINLINPRTKEKIVGWVTRHTNSLVITRVHKGLTLPASHTNYTLPFHAWVNGGLQAGLKACIDNLAR